MVRIFITSNPISTVLMSMYARRTRTAGVRDILCIDHYYKKQALIDLIYESAALHQWQSILDFSTHIENDSNLKPGIRAKVMRRVKHFPLLKQIYQLLLARYLRKKAVLLASKLQIKLEATDNMPADGERVEIYQLTQTELNIGAELLFTDAEVFYMEHGTVDYIYVIEKVRKSGYICIFKESYEKYLAKRKISLPVLACLNREEFDYGFRQAAPAFDLGLKSIARAASGRYVLVLMDALEKFNPSGNFWTDYIDRCLAEVSEPKRYLFVVKPHPTQSNEVIDITERHFKKLGLNVLMLNKPEHVSLSVETIYAYYQKDIEYVFSTFSAAIFYLAHFYGNQSRFYYAYSFVGRYIQNAPRQYRESYQGLKILINEVFASEHLISLE